MGSFENGRLGVKKFAESSSAGRVKVFGIKIVIDGKFGGNEEFEL